MSKIHCQTEVLDYLATQWGTILTPELICSNAHSEVQRVAVSLLLTKMG